VCGIATVLVAVVAAWILRQAIAKLVCGRSSAALSREVEDSNTLAPRMPRAVMAANHASFLDGLLLGAFLPGDRSLRRHLSSRAVVGTPFLAVRERVAGRSDQSPVDSRDDSRRRARIVVHHLPEGRITTTGCVDEGLRRPGGYRGAHRRPLVPIRIDGVEFTPFSRLRARCARALSQDSAFASCPRAGCRPSTA
jgi:acyl-[acyl-carrier-protein]-phospholipid O-acyltransferase/long-chain-fatty-acid--[acyl-carrier-protein] ligase